MFHCLIAYTGKIKGTGRLSKYSVHGNAEHFIITVNNHWFSNRSHFRGDFPEHIAINVSLSLFTFITRLMAWALDRRIDKFLH